MLYLRVGDVEEIKEIAIGMNDAIINSNMNLNKMTIRMDDSKKVVDDILITLNNGLSTNSGRHMCYVVLFILLVFLVLHWMINKSLIKLNFSSD